MQAAMFDFSGTLAHVESPEQAVLAALGPDGLRHVSALERSGALPGSAEPAELPPRLAQAWEERDLSDAQHRVAYWGLMIEAGLTEPEADRLYARVTLEPDAWQAFPDAVEVLTRLRAQAVPIALISNIGWDPRKVLAATGLAGLLDVLVLSDERGVIKPDPVIFRMACAELAVVPGPDVLMVGDNAVADGGAEAIGCSFALVPATVDRHPETLLRAAGLA